MEQKQNDWLATLFFQPDKTPQDLFNAGITTDNSELKDIDFYKNIPEIKQAFSDETGKFDDKKFNKYYNEALQLYNWADQQNFTNTLVENHTYDSMDIFAPKKSKVRNTSPIIVNIPNPERRAKGLTNFWETSDATMSAREVAETQLVVDSETGKELDWTPNDKGGLFDSLTRPTLVLATWDEDGYHDVDGRKVMHHKGEYKFNQYGDTYYETLGGRSAAGKDVLAWTDTLTVDGSKWNKYDFLDSDDLDKSMTGTIAKSIVKVAPLFIPGVGSWYAGLGAAIELGKLIPTLYKSISGIASGEISERSDTKTANEIEGWFRRFDNSMSDHGRESFFRFEQLMDVAASSFNQLKQQRLIGELPFKMVSKGQPSQKMINFGRNISWAYMAGTSSTDAYNMFKEAGASDRVAGLGMFAVTGAMFKLMNSYYFRDFWYEGSYLGNSQFRKALKNAAEQESKAEFTKEVIKQAEKETAKGAKKAAQWVVKQKDKLFEKLSKMKPTDIMYGAANEGLEEVMEEVSTDAVKGLFAGMNALGLVDKDRDLDFGITPEDMFSRYLTSAIGGAIGGAMFSLANKFDKSYKASDELIKLGGDGFKEIVYYARQGKTEQLHKELDRLRKKGALGSVNLSAFDYTVNKDGTYTYKTSKGENDSQNDVIYKRLSDYIDRIDAIVKEEGLNYSDDMLQIMSNHFLEENPNWDAADAKEAAKNWYKGIHQEANDNVLWNLGIGTQALQDWQDLTEQIVKTRAEMESIISPEADESKTPKDIEAKIEAAKNDKTYQEASKKLSELRKKRDELLNGSKTDFYFTQLQFAINKSLRDYIIDGVGIHEYTKLKHDKNYDDLSEEEKKIVDDEYAIFSKNKEKAAVLDAHKMFYELQEQTKKDVKSIFDKFNYDSKILESETEYTAFVNTQSKVIEEKQKQLDEILKNVKKDEELPEEAKKLQVEINKQKQILGSYEAMRYGIFRQKLTESGKKLLSRPTGGDLYLELDNYANSYLKFLDHLIKNNLYTDLVDSDLSQLFTYYLTSINPEGDPGKSIQKLAEDKITELLVDHYGTADVDDGDISTFINWASKIATALNNSDLDTIIQVMDEAKSIDYGFIAEMAQNDDTTPDKWLAEIFPNIGSKSLIDFVTEVKEKKSKLRTSPIYDLIEKVAKLAGMDDDLIQLITTEQQNLLNSINVRDFLIKDKNILNKLKRADKLINVVAAILKTTPEGGYNEKVNPARKEAKKDELPVFHDSEKIAAMLAQLARLKGQLQTLTNLAERNQAQKVRVNKDIEMVMRPKFLNSTLNDSLFQSNFEKAFGIDLKKMVDDAKLPTEVTDENYVEFVEKMTKLESEIYNAVKNTGLLPEELAAKLISLFDITEVAKMIPSEFGKDKDKKLTEYDKLIYIANIVGYDSLEFATRMKTQVVSFEAAPFYAQEYAIRCGFTSVANGELFNNIVANIKKETEKSSDKYLATRSPLYNFLIIYGGAGAGKTALVDKYITELIKSEAGIITCAPSTEQVEKLNKSISHEGKSFTKEELLKQITGKGVFTDEDLYEIMDGDKGVSTKLNMKVPINSTDLFGDSEIKVLFIDEISLFNRPELEAISRWAVKNNVQVVASGDYMQNSASCLYKGKYEESGVEDTIAIKTPDLEASIRSAVVAKVDNYNELRNALRVIHNYRMANPEFNYKQIDDFAVKHLEANPITIKYYESDDDFGGTKFIDDASIDTYIKKLSSLSDDVCIITDAAHVSKYSAYKNVTVRTFNTIQGAEFEYIIVDQHATKKGMLERLTDVYTITQRSKVGSIFAQPKPVWINNKEDKHSDAYVGLTKEQISEFRNWKISGYGWIGDVSFTPLSDLRLVYGDTDDDADTETGGNTTESTDGASTDGAVPFVDEHRTSEEPPTSETATRSEDASEEPAIEDTDDTSSITEAEESPARSEVSEEPSTTETSEERSEESTPAVRPLPIEPPKSAISVASGESSTVEPKPIAEVTTKKVEHSGIEIAEDYNLLQEVLNPENSNNYQSDVCFLGDCPFHTSTDGYAQKQFLYTMRMYFLRGYYKTDAGKNRLRAIVQKLLQQARGSRGAKTMKYLSAITNANWNLVWKQVTNKANNGQPYYVLCAEGLIELKEQNGNTSHTDKMVIPIFATNSTSIKPNSKYTGEFTCYKPLKSIQSEEAVAYKVDGLRYNCSAPVNTIGTPMVLVVTQKRYQTFDDALAEKIGRGKDVSISNNEYLDGQTFQCITDDPFITSIPNDWFDVQTDGEKITSITGQYSGNPDNHIVQVSVSSSLTFTKLIQLLGSKFKNILQRNGSNKSMNYLTGQRAGAIVGWLYYLKPEWRNIILDTLRPAEKANIGSEYVKIYSKSKDGNINTIYEGKTRDLYWNEKPDNVTEETGNLNNIRDQIERAIEAEEQLFIMPEFLDKNAESEQNSQRLHVSSFGDTLLMQVMYSIKQKTGESISKNSELCNQMEQKFKYGIYTRDQANINSQVSPNNDFFYNVIGNANVSGVQVIGISDFQVSQYKINLKNDGEVVEEKKVNKTNEDLKKNGIEKTVVETKEIPEVVQKVNEEQKQQTKTGTITEVVNTGNGVATKTRTDYKQLLQNLLKEKGIEINQDQIQNSEDRFLNYQVFAVSLEDQIKYFVLDKSSGNYIVRELPGNVGEKWMEVNKLRMIHGNELSAGAINYIDALLSNTSINPEDAIEFYQNVQNNKNLQTLKDIVNEFLFSKLETHEC